MKLVNEFCADHVADVRCAVINEKPGSEVHCEYVWKETNAWKPSHEPGVLLRRCVAFDFVGCDREQLMLLLPASVTDWFPNDHLA